MAGMMSKPAVKAPAKPVSRIANAGPKASPSRVANPGPKAKPPLGKPGMGGAPRIMNGGPKPPVGNPVPRRYKKGGMVKGGKRC